MPGLFLDEIADFSVNADKMAPSPSALFMPSVVAGGLHSPYSNKNNAQVFDQVQQQPLYSAQDLAAELAVKLGFNDASGNASASLATAFQQQQLQQTSFLAAYRNVTSGSDGLNSGGESRSSCSETDYAALNEPTAFELLHIAAAAAAHRKSQNTTECVPVPSSEHVAEIVGRQGCKIKALRAKTNTYIKTPVRGEDSIFVVTGRKEDVIAAKQEILSAAEHFTQIRASRRHSQGGIPAPGHITAYVRVPYKFVGLVVGPKGATIKRIQQQTHTYIVTPSRDKEPVFEVTGLSENVESARREIETHIGSRTGQIFQPTAFLDTNYNGMVVPNADFDLNNHHFNQSSPSNSIHSAAASILNDFHMNGTDSLSSCGVVGVCSSNADSSIISSSYGSQTSGSSSSSSSASSNNGLIQQFSGVVGQISKPTNNCILSAPALPTYQQQQCGNNEDSFSANSFISSQVQIGYNAWTNSTVNLNPRTVSSNNSDINGYLLLNGAKNLHSLSTVSKCGNSTETDNNGWFRSGFVNNSASFLNQEFLTPDFCNENQPRQQIPSSGVESSAPPPPCALLPSFLSSIWSNNDNVDDDLVHNNNHHVVKYHSASLGDSQTSTTANQNCQAGTSVDLKSVA